MISYRHRDYACANKPVHDLLVSYAFILIVVGRGRVKMKVPPSPHRTDWPKGHPPHLPSGGEYEIYKITRQVHTSKSDSCAQLALTTYRAGEWPTLLHPPNDRSRISGWRVVNRYTSTKRTHLNFRVPHPSRLCFMRRVED